MTAHFLEEELLYPVTFFFFKISIQILSKLQLNFKLKNKISVKTIKNNDCIVDTYRLFFETQSRKYGRNLSWSCMMFPVRQPMIIIIKANTFDEFFSRNKL